MGCYGLGAGLHDAVALEAAFGPGAVLGFGAGEAGSSDILAPAGALLARNEVAAAAALGKPRYFFSFGNFALDEPALGLAAGAIEHLAAASGVGFMAVCLAAPGQGRTVYQGHLFEAGALRLNLPRAFALTLDGGVGVVAREFVAAGAAAIRAQCGRLKEQGKVIALIDAVDDDDCAAVAEAMAAMPLTGGSAAFRGTGGGRLDATPATGRLTGAVAILSGARDRQTVFQIGAARASLAVFDLDFAAASPVQQALDWAARLGDAGAFIITSSGPPERQTKGAPAAAMLGEIARGLAAAGIRRFIIAGDETARAVREALGITRLNAGMTSGEIFWLQNERFFIAVKPPGAGPKNLFLSDFEPHLRLNNIAEMVS